MDYDLNKGMDAPMEFEGEGRNDALDTDKLMAFNSDRLFCEYLLAQGESDAALGRFCTAARLCADTPVRLVLLRPMVLREYADLYFIRNIAIKQLGKGRGLCSAVLDDHVLLLADIRGTDNAKAKLVKARSAIERFCGCELEVVYSHAIRLDESRDAYARLKKCLGYAFYTDGKAMLREELCLDDEPRPIRMDYAAIEDAVKRADVTAVKDKLSCFFDALTVSNHAPAIAKTYCLELYVCIIRCCGADRIDRYMKGIMLIQEMSTLTEIRSYISETAMEILKSNSPEPQRDYSALIAETVRLIDRNLGNEELSLRWLARSILYTNVDYLGKLFKREVGTNFSHYVMEKRMEMAKVLISEGKNDKIYEVAEKVGYGSNSQYFSQVFKKYTGVSPVEYKECVKAGLLNQ